MANRRDPSPVSGLSQLASDYSAILCDVWGVIHNGVRAFEPACEALSRFRAEGGRVLLITNAPRPAPAVVEQLDALGVPREAYDGIVTSGDTTRALLGAFAGQTVLHLGPDRDLSLYDGLGLTLGGEKEAVAISCTGLYDDTKETPSDYDEQLAHWAARELPMICANPDIVVERGDRLVWCAGALAERYAELGGEAARAGKPYPPIYEAAFARLAELDGAPVERGRILAVGDGPRTDLIGAIGQGLDALFVTAGIHGRDFDGEGVPKPEAVAEFLADQAATARAYLPRLVWAAP